MGRPHPLRGLRAEPVVLSYDENVWAVALDYHGHPVDMALATVRAVRAYTAVVLRGLPEEAWAREGRHTASGRYTALDWLTIYAESGDPRPADRGEPGRVGGRRPAYLRGRTIASQWEKSSFRRMTRSPPPSR